MSQQELATMDAVGQAELVRQRQISPIELVDSAIGRIEALDPVINAVTYERFEQAREEAKRPLSGPFAGVPMLLKDIGAAALGEPLHQGNVTLHKLGVTYDRDSYVVRRFRDAGFIVLGRTNVPEFGLIMQTQNAAFGATRNPWNLDYTPNGSSGGSAAAVASGMVPVAHGNDGGGSVRMPAAACGLVGLKPSRGRVSDGPIDGDLLFGHAVTSVLTRTVRDAGALLDVMAGPEPGDPLIAPPPPSSYFEGLHRRPRPLRIGYVEASTSHKWSTDPRVSKAVRDTAELLAGLGHQVVESWPEAMFDERYWSNWFDALSAYVVTAVEAVTALAERAGVAPEFDKVTDLWLARGREISVAEHTRALLWLDDFRRRMAGWWSSDGFDVLLAPVTLTPPLPVGWFWSYPEGIQDSVDILQFTPQFNSTGAPAISIPAAWTEEENLPIGVQLVGRYGEEHCLLSIAAEIEEQRPWAYRYPAVPVSSPSGRSRG